MEIWKDIEGYNNKYQISNYGRIKSLCDNHLMKREVILKPRIANNGYLYINLYKNSKCKTKRIHRLVAETFIDNPNNLPQVNHIDGNKLNNKANNLEWVSASDNCKHAYINGLSNPINNLPKDLKGKNNPKAKKIIQLDINNNPIKKWETIKEASETLKINHISACCRGNRKTAGGYVWKYVDDMNE